MRVRAEIGLAIGALLCVQVATSFGAIALLNRMSPAIAQILSENLYSLEAVDEMLAALISAERDPERAEERFVAALARARSNVTEPEEPKALEQIESHFRAALGGDREARDATVLSLESLAHVNHATTRRADAAARRLGGAGAWAVAFLGAFGSVLSAVVIARLTRKVLRPIAEIRETVAAFRDGDPHRRTSRGAMSPEFQEVAQALDDLLDGRGEGGAPLLLSAGAEPPERALGALERRALIRLLADLPHPTLLLDESGRIRAASPRALVLLDDDEAGRALLERIRRGPPAAGQVPSQGEGPGEGELTLSWTPLEGGALCGLQTPPASASPGDEEPRAPAEPS